MAHTHTHHYPHSHGHQPASLNGIFVVSIVLNLLFVAIEAGVGFYENSLSLLSDAGHNLSDVFSLVLALTAFKLAGVHPTRRFTYGYRKSTVLISLLNAIILLVAVGAIVIESLHKIDTPEAINGHAVSVTAGVGIVVNGLTAWLLMRSQKDDLNVRGAFLHMAADTLVSVGVVVSGLVITYTGFTLIDPLISLLIAAVILVSTWHLLTESLRLSLDAAPQNIDRNKVDEILNADEDICGAHHIHVWAISTTETALTAHLVLKDINRWPTVRQRIRERLKRVGIEHCTLEAELAGEVCGASACGV